MKKILTLSLLLLTLTHLTGYAQVGELRHHFALGINGGANLSKVDFAPTIKQSLLPGYTGGLTMRYTSEKYFSLICATQLEVNFSQRGWREFIDDGSHNTYSRTTNYVEVPFFAHVGWGRERRGFQVFLNLGPQIGFYLGDREHYGFTQEHPWDTSHRPNRVVEQYGKAVENTFEYGITGGLGVELKTGIGNFLLEGRYFFGLSDMFGNSKADDFGRSANTTIGIKLSYLIDLF